MLSDRAHVRCSQSVTRKRPGASIFGLVRLSSLSPCTTMSDPQSGEDAQRAAKTFNRILNQPKLAASSGQRTDKQIEEGIKKLRRLILVDGIPHAVVSIKRFLLRFLFCVFSFMLCDQLTRVVAARLGPDAPPTCMEDSPRCKQHLCGQIPAIRREGAL